MQTQYCFLIVLVPDVCVGGILSQPYHTLVNYPLVTCWVISHRYRITQAMRVTVWPVTQRMDSRHTTQTTMPGPATVRYNFRVSEVHLIGRLGLPAPTRWHSLTGAWWYSACLESNLNGIWYPEGTARAIATGVCWVSWGGFYYSYKVAYMRVSVWQPLYIKSSIGTFILQILVIISSISII